MKSVLIVEDERSMAKALEIKLTRAGYKVTTVFNGAMALESLEREVFDLIMCDLIMPKVDGFKLLEELRTRNISTPVMIMTNLSQEEDKARTMALGARDFLVKSNTPIADILERVKVLLA